MITIVPMTIEHMQQVYQIEEESFSLPWSRQEFEKEIRENQLAIYIVALCDGEAAGYAGMWHVVTEGHITNVAVKPEFRRRGIGGMLVRELIKIACEKQMIGLTLEVRMGNAAAQKLYTSNGFRPEGFRKNYYSDTKEDAIIMWKYFN